jgi:hypothetical protein
MLYMHNSGGQFAGPDGLLPRAYDVTFGEGRCVLN